MDDLLKQLQEAGISTDSWQSAEGGPRPLPATLVKQREALLAVCKLLRAQVDKDRALVAGLYEQLNRINHGGGS